MQLEQPALLTLTLTLETVVAALVLLLLALTEELHAYAPTYSTLIDPPYEFAPSESSRLDVIALQLEQPALLTLTLTLETVVAPAVLLLLPSLE
jgi:hypothetical protein